MVYATGAASFIGRTTALVETAGAVSHFQRAVLRIGNYLIVMAVALVTLTVVVSLICGNPGRLRCLSSRFSLSLVRSGFFGYISRFSTVFRFMAHAVGCWGAA